MNISTKTLKANATLVLQNGRAFRMPDLTVENLIKIAERRGGTIKQSPDNDNIIVEYKGRIWNQIAWNDNNGLTEKNFAPVRGQEIIEDMIIDYIDSSAVIQRNGEYIAFFASDKVPCGRVAIESALEFAKTYIKDNVVTLANAFSAKITEELTDQEFVELNEANKREIDTGICHTHDYVDANVLMLDAFNKAFGREADLQADSDLINDAWNVASKCQFKQQYNPNL